MLLFDTAPCAPSGPPSANSDRPRRRVNRRRVLRAMRGDYRGFDSYDEVVTLLLAFAQEE